MVANQGSFRPLQIFLKKTQCKSQERILGLSDAWELHVWIGRGDIVSHLLSVQETNS